MKQIANGQAISLKNLKNGIFQKKMSYTIKFIPEAEETFNEMIIQIRQRWGLQKLYLKNV